MSFQERKELYARCEQLRGRPLVVYVTSIRDNVPSYMAEDAIPQIIKQIDNIPADKKEIDFLIISNGGDPITALRIINILRERFEEISVLIPYVAYSAATILALGANDIVMHPYSNLGPVDPQITVVESNDIGQPSQINFGSEDIRNYIDFIKTDVGITDQQYLMDAFGELAKKVGPLPIGSSKRGQQLSLSLSIKMLEMHTSDHNKAKTIASALNSAYYHHGYAVGRSEAEEIGLNITKPNEELKTVLWSIWEDFCAEMKCANGFNPLAEIMNNPDAKSIIASIPTLNLPAGTPPDVANNLLVAFLQQHGITQPPPVELKLSMASIESTRLAAAVISNLSVIYWRTPDMNLNFNVTGYSDGWECVYEEEVQ